MWGLFPTRFVFLSPLHSPFSAQRFFHSALHWQSPSPCSGPCCFSRRASSELPSSPMNSFHVCDSQLPPHMRHARPRLCLLCDMGSHPPLLSLKSYCKLLCPPLHTLHAPKVSLSLILPQHKAINMGPACRRHSINTYWMNEIWGSTFCCFSLVLKPSVLFNCEQRVDAQGILMINLSHHSQNNYLVFSCLCPFLFWHRNASSLFSHPWSMLFPWSSLLTCHEIPFYCQYSTRFWNLGQGQEPKPVASKTPQSPTYGMETVLPGGETPQSCGSTYSPKQSICAGVTCLHSSSGKAKAISLNGPNPWNNRRFLWIKK